MLMIGDKAMQLLVFLVISTVIAILSWPSLRNPRVHGFYRFFAFETVLLLILLNSTAWFQHPFALLQVFSWILLLGSLILAIHGFYLLRVIGKPRGKIEDTTRLVTQGAYCYIRHPLYASLLLFGAGALLKEVSWTSLALFIALAAFLIAAARIEEAENLQHFGSEYTEYMKKTKMFIPNVL